MPTTETGSLVTRPATEADDLTALFPESVGRRLSRHKVIVVTDGPDLLAASILWDAGHDILYVGATRFTPSSRRPWVVRALWRGVIAYAKTHRVIEILHPAGTRECAEAFVRLGATPSRKDDVVLSLMVDAAAEPSDDLASAMPGGTGPEIPMTGAIRFSFVSPFNTFHQEQLRALRAATAARIQHRPYPWDELLPIFGAWDAKGHLVGYIQFSMGPGITWQYGARVAHTLRGQGLGRRLFAAWLLLTQKMGVRVAIGSAEPGNTATRALFSLAHFEERGVLPVTNEVLYVGEAKAFEWAAGEPTEGLAWASPQP